MLNLLPNDLILLDRGYPAYWIFNLILSVYQDFHSKVLAKNLTWILSSPAQEAVENENHDKKHEDQLNMTQAISKSKDTIFLLFERTREMIVQLIKTSFVKLKLIDVLEMGYRSLFQNVQTASEIG